MTEKKKPRGTQLPPAIIRGFSAVHRAIFRATRGRLFNKFRGGEMLLLTTTGRKTGEARTWPLLYLKDGPKMYLAASNGGHHRHPAWYLNLEAKPEATIELKGRTVAVRARILEGAERDEHYGRFKQAFSGYAAYEQATERVIPVVELTPE
jgi:deazaflavin-dependent oxidoreductase (nitroreductase family)